MRTEKQCSYPSNPSRFQDFANSGVNRGLLFCCAFLIYTQILILNRDGHIQMHLLFLKAQASCQCQVLAVCGVSPPARDLRAGNSA